MAARESLMTDSGIAAVEMQIVALLMLIAPAALAPAAPARATPWPRNISFDGRAMLFDGERRLVLAGSVHYARSTPEMWSGIMAASKVAGIDTIMTYSST